MDKMDVELALNRELTPSLVEAINEGATIRVPVTPTFLKPFFMERPENGPLQILGILNEIGEKRGLNITPYFFQTDIGKIYHLEVRILEDSDEADFDEPAVIPVQKPMVMVMAAGAGRR